MAVLAEGRKVVSWGWPLCTRTSYRSLDIYETFPRIVRVLSMISPIFSAGKDQPSIEATFHHEIIDLKLGCGFATAVDARNNVYAWGDNYAGQLSQGDDIHRDSPVLIRSLAEANVTQISNGF